MAAFKYSQEQLQDAFWKRWQRSMEFEGYEVSDEQVRNSRREYDVAYGVRNADALAAVVAFFEARNGMLYGFRF